MTAMIDCVSSIERDRIRTSLDPRLAFNSVTARVFPLKASMNKLQDFCDNYLNFVDDEKSNRPSHYFKPAMPWVFCQVLNYGEMTNETRSRGWISQHEVAFVVPLEWYVVEKGELKFRDWAMISPFIFVDNDISVTTGREFYGWVKVRAWLDRLDPNWADDPRQPRCLIDLSTELFPRAYAGDALAPRTLLQLTQAPPPDVFRDPFSKDAMFGPGWTWAEAARTSVEFVRKWFEAAAAFPLQGYGPRSVPSTVDMLTKGAFNLTRFMPWWQPDRDTVREALERAHARGRNYYLNQINLKQFRDAEEPTFACYQALVNSKITIDHYYNGGLLGAASVACGDITGGIRLMLHDYPEQQIQSTLGLEVEEWQQAPDNHRVAVLVPQFPFWTSYDLHYDNGDTLCWRTKTSDWQCDPCQTELCRDGRANAFNAAEGVAIQEQYGPNVYPDVTLRVFPLEADEDTLRRYCDDNINKQGDPPLPGEDLWKVGDHYLEPWGAFVYMCVITHSNVDSIPFSHGNNIGPTARDEVIFYLPVKWYRRQTADPASTATTPLKDGSKNLRLYKLGVLTPFAFGHGRQVISEREVNGLSSTYGELAGGADVWLNTFRGKERSVLAELTTLLVTAVDVGQPASQETLIEVVSVPRVVLNDLQTGSTTFGDILLAVAKWLLCWMRRIVYWIQRIFSSILPLSIGLLRPRFLDYLAEFPLNRVSLKRILMTGRSAGKKATHECAYQALVLAEQTIDSLFDSGWVDNKHWALQRFVDRLDDDIRIDIRYYETLDIAGTLGLKGGIDISRPGSAPAQEFRPHDPFAIRMHVTEGLGYNVATKVNSEPWGEDLPVVPKAKDKRPFEFPQTPGARSELNSFAKKDGPQRMISRYVRKYGRGGTCWKLPN
jgi:hypothetical protein